ncbi:A disintegrin and metalloproteinase with thrombospondin motifs 9-like [Littorina saxatilis]|uniref:PLAC domain-containing protein n=1 Tax=Littorina saxatilis TaxID=31220 RepID=A0AAN9C3W8_9CAEN
MLLHSAAGVLVLQVCVLCSRVLANPGAGRGAVATGEWGSWSSWTSCSADCSSGITTRSRRCQHPHHLLVASLLSSADDSVTCTGSDKEIKLCNKNRCSEGKKSWREEECSKFDSQVHAGRTYTWEPFVHPTDPCKLTCRARGQHFYSKRTDRVIDGTPCGGATTNPSAVCVHDVCEEVGCDDLVGSPWRRDACGVCKGDNSTCRTVSGVFAPQHLSRGFNHIIAIPAGSSQINITGLRYSINYIALQFPGGDFILNGGLRKAAAGDFDAAGTIFSYKTNKECGAGQCIFADGPTEEDIDLMLNTRGSNRGVMYSFNVPINVTNDYFRRIIGTTNGDIITTKNDNDSIAGEQSSDNDGDSLDEDHDVDDEADEFEEDEVKENEAVTSISIPLQSLVDPNEMGKDSIFYKDNNDESDPSQTQSPDEQESSEDSDYWSQEDWTQHSDDEEDDEEESDNDFDEVGAPEPIEQKEVPERKFKIIRKARPRFIEPEDTNGGSFANSARNFEFQANTQNDVDNDDDDDDSDDDDDEDEEDYDMHFPEDSLSFQDLTTAASETDFDQVQTTPFFKHSRAEDNVYQKDTNESDTEFDVDKQDSFSADQPQQRNQLKDTPTSQPQHLLRPQSDSPTRPTHSYRSQTGGAHAKYYRYRRPNYSQSFTFRRSHQINVQAAKKVSGSSGDRSSMHRGSRPRSSTYSASPQPPTSRQIRVRPQPRGQSASQRYGTSSFSGYERPSSYDTYRRTAPRMNTNSQSSSSYNNRRRYPSSSSSSSSQRQALTLGQTVSREQDETVQITSTNTGRGSSSADTRSREENLRLQQQRSRKQEYERQQEEYRRELQRRRQDIEQQRAAQSADYQRRLDEHNRRLRQREMEIEQRKRDHNRQRHHGRHPHHRHQGRQPTVPQSSQTGGTASRPDTAGRGASSSPSQRGGVDQRMTNTRLTPSSRPSSSADTRAVPDISDRRRQPVITNRRRPAYVTPIPDISDRRRQPVITNRRQPAYVTPAPPTTPSTTTVKTTTTQRYVPPTPPPTRGFLTNPAPQPVNPTLPSIIPRTGTFVDQPEVPQYIPEGPGAPQYIPDDSEYNPRSSLTAALSNQLPNTGDSPLVIGSQGNIVPNIIERGPLVGGEGSIDREDKMSYEWRVSGLTECTLTCGGGMQQTVVVCLDMRTQAVVTDGNCRNVERPKAKGVTCNTRPCPARWQPNQWSPCSVSCGPGEQSRLVPCLTRVSATLNVTMPDENCLSEGTKPDDRRACQNLPCNTWREGNWSECSVQCGEGIRTRDVICVDQTGFDVSDDLCPGSKPTYEEACEMGPCGKGWYYTDWPEQCPAECGSGSMSRHVTCLDEGGSPLPDTSCDSDSRPLHQQSCKADAPCGGQWFTGEWEKCNATCGAGHKEREVVCMKALPGGLLTVVDDENCLAAERPDTWEPCEGGQCGEEWYMTSWTECSQSCGTGHRTREARCLDPSQRPSADCSPEDKPRTREACNTHRCTAKLPSTTQSNSDCQDSFSRCEIVKHARMCRFDYYRKICCATCSEET